MLDDESIAANSDGRALRPLPVHIAMAWSDPAQITELESNTAFIKGIKAYQEHPYKRDLPVLETVWQEGSLRVYKSPAQTAQNGKDVRAVLLVPSLINKAHILDMTAEKSFVRWLARQGLDVYLCDWGDVLADPEMKTLDSLIAARLYPAVAHVADLCDQLTGLGYCMGGTLLCGAAAKVQQFFDKLIFLASPWDFHAGDRILQRQISTAAPAALDMVAAKGYLPMEWIQSVFAVVNGDRAKDKFVRFALMDQDSDKARLFVAVEEWLNDGVPLPGAVAKTCIEDWYIKNTTGTGKWILDGQAVKPSAIAVPSLVVASERDRLVPKLSSEALYNDMDKAELLSVSSGHIGMITGSNAQGDMWQPVFEWIMRD